jgi:hypothetical protein
MKSLSLIKLLLPHWLGCPRDPGPRSVANPEDATCALSLPAGGADEGDGEGVGEGDGDELPKALPFESTVWEPGVPAATVFPLPSTEWIPCGSAHVLWRETR